MYSFIMQHFINRSIRKEYLHIKTKLTFKTIYFLSYLITIISECAILRSDAKSLKYRVLFVLFLALTSTRIMMPPLSVSKQFCLERPFQSDSM